MGECVVIILRFCVFALECDDVWCDDGERRRGGGNSVRARVDGVFGGRDAIERKRTHPQLSGAALRGPLFRIPAAWIAWHYFRVLFDNDRERQRRGSEWAGKRDDDEAGCARGGLTARPVAGKVPWLSLGARTRFFRDRGRECCNVFLLKNFLHTVRVLVKVDGTRSGRLRQCCHHLLLCTYAYRFFVCWRCEYHPGTVILNAWQKFQFVLHSLSKSKT